MKIKAFVICILIMLSFSIEPVFATDYVVPKTMSTVSTSTFRGIGPGDRLLISAGNRGPLTIRGLRGEPGKPIVVINSGGRVNIDATWVGIDLSGCKYIKLTGSGIKGITYGFLISDGSNLGVRTGEKTDEIEIEYVEVTNVNIGISSQTIKDINGDPVGREWTQYNTTIHHCYIHDVRGEGMYIGCSNYSGGIKPILKGVYIHDNILKNVGYDGIQVGSATNNVEVYNNTITDAGLSDQGSPPSGANGQMGIIINKGTVGSYHDNRIENPRRHGIYAQGLGNYNFYNNVIVNAGVGEFGGNGVAISIGSNFTIKNNNIHNSEGYGIYINSSIKSGAIFDNSILGSGKASITANGLSSGNIYNNNLSSFSTLNLAAPTDLELKVEIKN